MEDEILNVAVKADTSELDTALDDLSRRANSFGRAMTTAFRGAVSGGRSLEDVFKQLALRISDIALDAAMRPLANLLSQGLGSALGSIGEAFGGGGGASVPARVTPFAKGGVVASPSYFPAGRELGLMGEAGAEAILPLRRGSDGRLGVGVPEQRGTQGAIVFNVNAQDAQSFLRAETQIQAMLARAAQRGRRGL